MTRQNNEDHEIYCNQCGQVVSDCNDYADYLKVTKSWGYFSDKDLETHTFILCESCYDHLVKGFALPIRIKKTNEAI